MRNTFLLSSENLAEVAGLIGSFLAGKKFTWVEVHPMYDNMPEIYPHMQLEGCRSCADGAAENVTAGEYEIAIHCTDWRCKYGILFIGGGCGYGKTRVDFEPESRNHPARIEITDWTGSGDKIRRVLFLED